MVADGLLLGFAFLAGSLPFSWLIGERLYDIDLRRSGDRNVGSGNLMAVAGFLPGFAALVLDVLKGAVATGAPIVFGRDEWVVLLAAILAVVGHVIPPWLGFAGGRGAAAAIGASFTLFPVVGILTLAVGLAVLLLTRNTSLAIAALVICLVAVVLLTGMDRGRLAFVVLLFISVGLKDAWDRLQRRRSPSLSEAR